jgi:hypothetical protein
MDAAVFAAMIGVFVSVALAMFGGLVLSGKPWQEAQDRARARRMAEHRMNARLLRLDI